MNKILCSTGALLGRPNGRDFTLLKKFVDKLDCDGYEFMMYDTWYDKVDIIREFMQDFSYSIPTFHIEKQIGELISSNDENNLEKALKLFEINCALAKDLNAKKLVLHLWSGLDSDKNIEHNINCYKFFNEISSSYKLSLSVENIVCNHKDPMSHLITLAKTYPDIEFTFDTKMASFHNQIDMLYEEENSWLLKSIKHMHINDYNGGYKDWKNLRTLHIGDGLIDFAKLFEFLKRINYQGDFTIEATSFDQNGNIDFEALNKDFDKIRALLK